MYPALEIIFQHIVNSAVLRHAAHTGKVLGRDSDTKMGFTTLPPSGVAMVLHRLVDHIEESGRKSIGELCLKGVFDAHGTDLYLVLALN